MRVKMQTLAAGPDGVIPVGAIVDVDAETGQRLVAGGYATPVTPHDVETALAPEPEVAAKRTRRSKRG